MKRAFAAAIMLISAAPAGAAMNLGVNTHFDQGWPLSAFEQIRQSGAAAMRETVQWGKVERSPGIFAFTAKNSGFVDIACTKHIPVLLVITPRNELYDIGKPVFSPTGQRALARYARVIVERFPCVMGLEIGNEINGGPASKNWPAGDDKAKMYVSMLRAIRNELDRQPRRVALVGGSSIGVAVDFHARLFAAGELPLIDAVAIHPYTNNPEVLPSQLDRLRMAMQAHGAVKPIWATEFGNYYKRPDDAPPHALKVITILSAAGVQRAFWYALLDEPWYPNMGLFGAKGAKPALATFEFAARSLLAAGDSRRLSTEDAGRYIYRFGNGPYVTWGSGALPLPSRAKTFDAAGRAIPAPTALGPDPIVVVPR